MDFQNNQPLAEYLDKYRPDRPTCDQVVARDYVDSVLLMSVPKGEYAGLTYIQAAVLAKLKVTIEDPCSKGAASLGDLAKISADRKQKMEHEAGDSLKDLFLRLKEKPSDVLVVDEVQSHGGRR